MSILDLDSMLEQSLSETVAAPDFVTPENGIYVLTVKDTSAEKKEAKDKKKAEAEGKPTTYVQLKFFYNIDEVVEQEGAPIRVGSLFSETFTVSDAGLPFFKKRVAEIAVSQGEDAAVADSLSIKEALEMVKGVQFKTTIKQRKNGDNTNVNLNNLRPVAEE